MAPLPPDQRQLRARIAITSRWRPDDPALVEQRRDLRAARAEQYLRGVLEDDPSLRDRLLLVLTSGGDAA